MYIYIYNNNIRVTWIRLVPSALVFDEYTVNYYFVYLLGRINTVVELKQKLVIGELIDFLFVFLFLV